MKAYTSLKRNSSLLVLLLGLMIICQGNSVTARDENITGHFFTDAVLGGEGWVRYYLPDNNSYAITSNITISNFSMNVDEDLNDMNANFRINHSTGLFLLSINHFEFGFGFNISEYEHDNITYYPAWNSYFFIIIFYGIVNTRVILCKFKIGEMFFKQFITKHFYWRPVLFSFIKNDLRFKI